MKTRHVAAKQYEAAIALNNAAVTLLYRHQYRSGMSVLQDAIYVMNHIVKTNHGNKANRKSSLCRCHDDDEHKRTSASLHCFSSPKYQQQPHHDNDDNEEEEDITRRLIAKAEHRLSSQSRRYRDDVDDDSNDIVVITTADLNPEMFFHDNQEMMKHHDYIVYITMDDDDEIDDVEELDDDDDDDDDNDKIDVDEDLPSYDIHSAMILCNYAVACKRCAYHYDPFMKHETSKTKVIYSSFQLFQLSYSILQRQIQRLPSSDRFVIILPHHDTSTSMICDVYSMSLLVLRYLTHLTDLQQGDHRCHHHYQGMYVKEFDRLANNYTIMIDSVIRSSSNNNNSSSSHTLSSVVVGKLVTAPAA